MMLRDFEGGMGAWVAVALLALACSATSTETSSSGGSSSGSVGIYKNTQPQCTPTTVGMDIRTTGTHPETVKRTCLLQPGCIWTRADGTVIDHLD